MSLALIGGNLANFAFAQLSTQDVQLMVLLLAVTLVVALIARRLRLPYTLALVIVGLAIGLSPLVHNVSLDPNVVLLLFLPALLFEGAWNTEVERLVKDWLPAFLLAVPGLLIALGVLAVVLHLGIGLPWLLAILTGAILSPTDPIAALAILRRLNLSERLYTVIEGESLFNDGVGTTVFEIVLELLLPSLGLASVAEAFKGVSWPLLDLEMTWLFIGGPLLGLLVGWIVARFLMLVNDHLIETAVTFSVAYGSYLLGTALHTSGLLAVVCAGLVMGSYGRNRSLSQRAQEAAQDVWEFIGYLANSLLFLLLGIQIGDTNLLRAVPAILWALLGVIAGRALIVYTLIPLHNFIARLLARKMPPAGPRRVRFQPLARLLARLPRHMRRPHFLPLPHPLPTSQMPLIALIGMRGALSIALVLSLPTDFAERELLEGMVYGVVLVTLLGQGLALRFLLPHWRFGREEEQEG